MDWEGYARPGLDRTPLARIIQPIVSVAMVP